MRRIGPIEIEDVNPDYALLSLVAQGRRIYNFHLLKKNRTPVEMVKAYVQYLKAASYGSVKGQIDAYIKDIELALFFVKVEEDAKAQSGEGKNLNN